MKKIISSGLLIWISTLLFVSCGEETSLKFPETFLFGVSISGFQGDMGCPNLPSEECDDKKSDWYQWIASKEIFEKGGIFHSGDPVSAGPGQWELFESDYQLVQEKLSAKTYRMSIEWSRIFPEPTFQATTNDELKKIANQQALAQYRKMFQSLRAKGIEPYVTLLHYTLPTWMHDGVTCHLDNASCKARGWAEPEKLIAEVKKYAGFVAKEFGDVVDVWITVNEPVSAVVLPAYLFQTPARINPPARLLAYDEAKKAFIGQIQAHAAMYKAIKQYDTTLANQANQQAAFIGIAHSMVPVAPKDPGNKLDQQAAKNIAYIINEIFLNAIILGKLDKELDGNKVDAPELKGLDFIGFNYYQRLIVKGTETSALPKLSSLATVDVSSLLDPTSFQSYVPEGIYEILVWLKKYNMPISITENGFEIRPSNKDDSFQIEGMEAFFIRHLFWIQRAIEKDNVRIFSYNYWSFIDNYEWNHGMKLRFGLFTWKKDDPSKKRIARPMVSLFQQISTKKELTKELLEKYLTKEEKKLLPESFQKK